MKENYSTAVCKKDRIQTNNTH